MNEVYHRRYILEFDVWEPYRKLTDDEFDKLAFAIKTKELLGHAANVKLAKEAEDRL